MYEIYPRLRRALKRPLFHLLGPYRFELLRFFLAHKHFPNLRHPSTFNEKIVWRKLYDRNPLYVQIADKWAVRDFVRQRLGDQVLKQVYWVGDQPETIDWDSLPSQFVLKAAHGSGPDSIRFIHHKEQYSKEELRAMVRQLLQVRVGLYSNEWFYTQIPPRVLIEELLHDPLYGIPLDYKFYVFHGKAYYIQVDYDRFGNHQETFYDCKWIVQKFTKGYPPGPISPKPAQLEEMTAISETLGKDFDFIRVDLYNPERSNRVVFGELTSTVAAGWLGFSPPEWDRIFGELWEPFGTNVQKVGTFGR